MRGHRNLADRVTIVVFLAALPFFLDALGHVYTVVVRSVSTGAVP